MEEYPESAKIINVQSDYDLLFRFYHFHCGKDESDDPILRREIFEFLGIDVDKVDKEFKDMLNSND